MQEAYIQDKAFENIDFIQSPLAKGEYENCTFRHCNFADADISGFQFIDCEFDNCNLSLAKLSQTVLRDIKFKDCKMLGLRFDTCHEFGLSFSFDGCQLDHSSFYKRNLKKTVFKNAELKEADFTEADLASAVFDNCNLAQTTFNHTNLEKADLATSYNYSLDPEINRIKKAKFSISGIAGLLGKYDISIVK